MRARRARGCRVRAWRAKKVHQPSKDINYFYFFAIIIKIASDMFFENLP
jgi:hypothetical protein